MANKKQHLFRTFVDCTSTLGRFGRTAKTAVRHVEHHVALLRVSASASDGH